VTHALLREQAQTKTRPTTCRVEDFSLSAAAETTQEALRGRFVLQTLTFMGAAGFRLGG